MSRVITHFLHFLHTLFSLSHKLSGIFRVALASWLTDIIIEEFSCKMRYIHFMDCWKFEFKAENSLASIGKNGSSENLKRNISHVDMYLQEMISDNKCKSEILLFILFCNKTLQL